MSTRENYFNILLSEIKLLKVKQEEDKWLTEVKDFLLNLFYYFMFIY